MDLGKALTESMHAAGFRDEDVAVKTGLSAQMVMKYRRGFAVPKQPNYDRLRREIPGFAERMDGKVVA